MSVRIVEFTPVAPLGSGLVHATTLATAGRTLCGRKCNGWRIVAQSLECQHCQDAVHRDRR